MSDVRKLQPILKKSKLTFNNIDLPSALRSIIVGQTGSGKTILLLRLLLYNLDFDDIVFCSPSLSFQDEYKIFISALENGLTKAQIHYIFEHQNELESVDEILELIETIASKIETKKAYKQQIKIYKSPSELPEPQELVSLLNEKKGKKKRKILLIIDNCMTKKNQRKIGDYFTYGRPLNINTIYLSQAYYELDKNTIRNNTQVFILFGVPDRDIGTLFNDLGSKKFASIEEFKTFANNAWSAVKDENGRNRGYIVVDKTNESVRANCF